MSISNRTDMFGKEVAMRVRTNERREAILRVATEVFREVGFARASMATIAGRLGGSKGTLYGYFASKEELFATAMMAVTEYPAQEAGSLLDTNDPHIAAVLSRFGAAYLALHAAPDALSLMRAAIAEGGNSKIGKDLYEKGCERAWGRVENYLAHAQSQGLIREGNVRIAATHLKGLLEAGVIEPPLYGAESWLSPNDAVVPAVEAFLRAYAPVR